MKTPSQNRRAGAALLLALWALFILSAMIVTWALDIDARLTLDANAQRIVEAEALASSGAELALHPAVTSATPLLRGSFGPRQTYEARITGEGGRLNLNWIVAGEQPERREMLRRYLEIKGVDLNERDRMIDALYDWVDPDNLVRLNGAEIDGDYQPANRLLTQIDELKEIRGWEEFTAREGWDRELTLNSSGPVDLLWAPRDVLLALPGMNDRVIDQFIAQRAGLDGVEGTEDDAAFENPEEIRIALSLSIDQFNLLAPLIGFRDQVVRIVSVGRSGNVTREIQMVVRKSGPIPQLISYKLL